MTIDEIIAAEDGATVTTAGSLTSVTFRVTKQGRDWSSATLADDSGSIEMLVYPEAYDIFRRHIALRGDLTVIGRIDRNDEVPRLVAEIITRPGEPDDDKLGAALGRLNRVTRRGYEVITDGIEYRPRQVIEELASELGYAKPRRDFENREPTLDDLYPALVRDQKQADWTRDYRRRTFLRVLGLAGGDPDDVATVLAAFELEPRDEEFANHIDEMNERTRKHWLERFQAAQAHSEAKAYSKGRREVLEDLRTLSHSGILDTRGTDLSGLDADIHREAQEAEALTLDTILSVNTVKDGQRVTLTGVIGNLAVQTSIGGNPREWAMGHLADDTGRVDVTVFPNRYAHAKDLVVEGALVVVTGRVEKWGGARLMVTTVEPAKVEAVR